MAADHASVFHDQSGRRRRRFRWAIIAFALLLVLSTVAFAATIMAVRPQAALPFAVEHPTSAANPARADFLHRSRRSLRRTANAVSRLWGGTRDDPNRPLAIAFHSPWDKASGASLQRHIEELDWLIPGWVSITGPDHRVTTFPDQAGRATIAHAIHRPVLLPMIQNAIDGNWDGAGMAALLRDPAARKRTLDQVEGADPGKRRARRVLRLRGAARRRPPLLPPVPDRGPCPLRSPRLDHRDRGAGG